MIKEALPEGWKVIKLRDVCKLKNGFAFKSTDYVIDGTPVIRISDIKYGTVTSKKSIKVNPHIEYENYLIENNDLLVAMSGATTGKFGIYKSSEKAYQNQRVGKFKILDNSALDNIFLYYQLHALKRRIEKDAYGGAQPNISSTKIEEMEILLPPLSEQQLIIEKLEELFSELDKSTENLKTAQQQLKVYRQAVLKWAFEGKFTNDEVKDGELPDGWERVKLGNTCNKIQDGSHFSPQVQFDEPGENRFMYITAKNIRNNYMDFSKLTYIDKDFHESIYGRCNPEYGDVLLTKDGVNTGEVTLNTLHEPFSLLSSVCIFKTKKDKLQAEYLKYFIQSPFGSKIILESMTGTAIKRIILRKIKDAEIIMPPLKEQIQIVQEIESRLSVCDKMEETITTSLQQAEALRQSIFKKAFEGKFVKTETKESINYG
jgi:type I restriction enzyme S subunit